MEGSKSKKATGLGRRNKKEEGGAIKGKREEKGRTQKDGRRGPETGKQGPALSSAAGCQKLGSQVRHHQTGNAAQEVVQHLEKRGNR